jgi:hypothetical protein
MKKVITILLLVSISISLVGCDLISKLSGKFDKDGHLSVGGNPGGKEDTEYWGCIAFNSYDEFINAWETYDNSKNEKFLSFNNVSEKYEQVYYTAVPMAWIKYPITTEDFVSKFGIPESTAYLFVKGDECCADHSHDLFMNLDAKYNEMQSLPYITITAMDGTCISKIDEISDLSLLSIAGTSNYDGYFVYEYKYGDDNAFRIKSCVELSPETLDELISHVVIVK